MAAITETVSWLSDFRFRRRFMRWTRQQLEQQHAHRFRSLITFAARRSPFYADYFARTKLDPKTVTLAEIPTLTKQDLIEHFDQICTVPSLTTDRIAEFIDQNPDPTKLLDGKFFAIRTSGTSGRPAYMAFSIREWIRGCSLQMRQTPGLEFRRRLAFIGATSSHYAGVSLALTGRRGLNRLFFDCRAFDHNLPIETIVDSLNQFQPQILSAYANIHGALAQQVARGHLQIRPEYVVSSGEPLRQSLRGSLEETYRTKVIDLYCSSETLLLAGGGSADGLMLYEEDNLIEQAADHCLVTNLFNRTFPLIRYRMNDVLQPTESRRPDSPFRWIARVTGRSEDPFELLNNDGELETVGPLSILYIPIPPVPGLQLVVNSATDIIFRILAPAEMPPLQRAILLRDTKTAIRNWLVTKRMDRHVQFQVVGVNQLEADPQSAKVKLIIRPNRRAVQLRAA